MRSARNTAFAMRRCAFSQKGYLLMVPYTAVLGDEVWAFAGGRALYVLRPAGREIGYTFVGECYAHGMMDGEIGTMLKAGELSMQEIHLV